MWLSWLLEIHLGEKRAAFVDRNIWQLINKLEKFSSLLQLLNCRSSAITEYFSVFHTTGKPLLTMCLCSIIILFIWNEQNLWELWIKLWKLHVNKLHLGLNILMKLNETLIDLCGVFSPSWAVWSVFSPNYFWPISSYEHIEWSACVSDQKV